MYWVIAITAMVLGTWMLLRPVNQQPMRRWSVKDDTWLPGFIKNYLWKRMVRYLPSFMF